MDMDGGVSLHEKLEGMFMHKKTVWMHMHRQKVEAEVVTEVGVQFIDIVLLPEQSAQKAEKSCMQLQKFLGVLDIPTMRIALFMPMNLAAWVRAMKV